MSKSKVRKWNEEYSLFGFLNTVDGVDRPKCILFDVIFSNYNLKPSKLRKDFKCKHGDVESGLDAET